MNVPLVNTTKENHIVTQKNHHHQNNDLVKIMFSAVLVSTTQIQYT